MLRAIPQRTADGRRAAPTPRIDPVTVCVVETGEVRAPACSIREFADQPLVRAVPSRDRLMIAATSAKAAPTSMHAVEP